MKLTLESYIKFENHSCYGCFEFGRKGCELGVPLWTSKGNEHKSGYNYPVEPCPGPIKEKKETK